MKEQSSFRFFSRQENLILIGLFSLLWMYLFLRGHFLPLMHDEIATYFYYIQSGVVFPPEAHYDANNHVLNSLLSHWSYTVFGNSPLALRLPNILAFAAFFFGLQGIAARIEHIVYRWGFVSAVGMSYFIFEYFSETRGYGLALAFLLMGIFQYIKQTETNKTQHIWLMGVFLWLSACANLTILVSAILLYSFSFLHSFLIDFKTNKARFFYKITTLLITGLPFLILAKWSFKLKELGLLYYGSLDGFYTVTLKSLLEVFTGTYHISLSVIITILFLLIVIFVCRELLKKKSLIALISGKNVLNLLLIGSVIIINLLAYFLDVNYPEDRAGMYLFIYFMGALAFTLSALTKQSQWFTMGILFYLFFPISFLANLSLRQATFVVSERHSDPIFELVQEEKSNFKFPLVAGGYVTQELCWYYMNQRSGGKNGRLHWSYHPNLDTDVQFISPERMTNPAIRNYYDSIYYDPAADLIYFKRKKFLEKSLLHTAPIDDVQNSEAEYTNFIQLPAASFIGKTLYLGVELNLDARAEPFNARLVAAVDRTEAPANLQYEFVQLNWIQKKWSGKDNKLLQGTLIHQVPEEAETISFYLWNPEKTTFSISNGKCYLYELEKDY